MSGEEHMMNEGWTGPYFIVVGSSPFLPALEEIPLLKQNMKQKQEELRLGQRPLFQSRPSPGTTQPDWPRTFKDRHAERHSLSVMWKS